MGPKKPSSSTSLSKSVKQPSGQLGSALPKVEVEKDIKNVKSKSAANSAALHLPQIVSSPTGKATDILKDPAVNVPTKTPSLSEEVVESISLLISTYCIAEVLSELAPPIIAEEIENEKLAKKARENGKVTLLYEMYAEEFHIIDGQLTSAIIDEEYCLSYVMPNCCIHLSQLSNRDRLEREANGDYVACSIAEDPKGTFHGLEAKRSYFVFIEQETEQLKRDQELMKQRAKTMEGAVDQSSPKPLLRNDGRAMEGCSCIYGNPCLDEYACRDWSNRFAISTKNGWKGF